MRREFNPEVMHESRELRMNADDVIADTLKEAFAKMKEPTDLEVAWEACDRWEEENQPEPEVMAMAADLPPMEEDEDLEEFDVAKARAFFA